MWGCTKKAAVCKSEREFSPGAHPASPWSGTSGAQNCEKRHFCCWSPQAVAFCHGSLSRWTKSCKHSRKSHYDGAGGNPVTFEMTCQSVQGWHVTLTGYQTSPLRSLLEKTQMWGKPPKSWLCGLLAMLSYFFPFFCEIYADPKYPDAHQNLIGSTCWIICLAISRLKFSESR